MKSNTQMLPRRDLLKLLASAAALTGCQQNAANAPTNDGESAMKLNDEWDKTFTRSDKVEQRKVSFKNRYGITLVGDLYLPKQRTARRLSALAVSGPFGAVKEQSSGLYAQKLAELGHTTIAFDPSFTGESGGEVVDCRAGAGSRASCRPSTT